MFKVLIVEDHDTLAYVLVEYLRLHDFEVILSKTAEEGIKAFQKHQPHLCLLDITLPGMDGFELAKKIKQVEKDMPVIFLTARGLKIDKLRGLKLQADDYLVKPVDEEELVLRIQSVLRRAYPHNKNSEEIFRIGSLLFETKNHMLNINNETRILTEKESAILEILCRHKENLVSRKHILKQVWGKTDHFTARTMDVHLTRIRKHLASDPSVSLINVHGQGFILKESKL